MTWVVWQKASRETAGWGVEIDVCPGELRGVRVVPGAGGWSAKVGELPEGLLSSLDVNAMRGRAVETGRLTAEVVALVERSPAHVNGRRPRPERRDGAALAEHNEVMLSLDKIAKKRRVNSAEFVSLLFDVSTKTAYRWLLDARE